MGTCKSWTRESWTDREATEALRCMLPEEHGIVRAFDLHGHIARDSRGQLWTWDSGGLPRRLVVQEDPSDEREALQAELAAWQRHTGDTALSNLLRRAASALAAITAEKERWRIRCAEKTIAGADEVAAHHRTVQGEPCDCMDQYCPKDHDYQAQVEAGRAGEE